MFFLRSNLNPSENSLGMASRGRGLKIKRATAENYGSRIHLFFEDRLFYVVSAPNKSLKSSNAEKFNLVRRHSFSRLDPLIT